MQDFRVRIVDVEPNPPLFMQGPISDEFVPGNLCDSMKCQQVVQGVTSVFHFAAKMGGMGTIHEANDFIIYSENHMMTINLLTASMKAGVRCFYYASSACVYPNSLQCDSGKNTSLREQDVWAGCTAPHPQGLYGLEKLNTEMILMQQKQKLDVRIARFHNIYGPGGAWNNGREKAPAAFLRKAYCLSRNKNETAKFEIWGDGSQRRSFLWIGDAVEAILHLFHSQIDEPINIGSAECITIQNLAEMALEVAGVDKDVVQFVYEKDKPIGVASRSSNNELVTSSLQWEPKVSIFDGMKKTGEWVKNQLQHTLKSHDSFRQSSLLVAYRESHLVDLNDAVTFGVLLPITSRGLDNQSSCLDHLENFALSFGETTWRDTQHLGGERFQAKFYLAMDEDDTFLLSPYKGEKENKPATVLKAKGLDNIKTIICSPGNICSIWRECAKAAWNDGCDYIGLMGDDVFLHDEGWMRQIHEEFKRLANVKDGDPFLYQLYRRWGCSTMLPCSLTNSVGGSNDSRYEKQHATEWSFETLDGAVEQASQWLDSEHCHAEKILTLDIIVPCYRVDLPILQKILELRSADTCSTMFIIIIDNPSSPKAFELETRYGHRVDVRIRRNTANIGASGSRNKGMNESAADWVLFLDDDVVPHPDLLVEAEKVIRKHPVSAGFIGNTVFPSAESIFTTAIRLSGITFFWDIATKIEEDVPWGVTANLIVRRNIRDGVTFNLSYPKTGGGEDVEFCLLKRKFALEHGRKSFIGAPAVIVTHPWWDNGMRSYRRCYMWSYGDGALIKRFPKNTYRDYSLNGAELLGMTAMVSIIAAIFQPLGSVIGTSTKVSLSIVIANVLHDCYRHLWRDAKRNDNLNTTLKGTIWYILAVIESAFIRMASEMGRLHGMLARREFPVIGTRFDWFTGRWGDGPKNEERRNSVQRLLIAAVVFCMIERID
ncbi:glycosyltransferase family 2 protein [Amanita thiersii Skay4041]|uniref:Glycosyltransferase family 2 protein n=1 Tax=Amanita thiersii Skay4041 TaxID=703135 RepID=A0A2A9NRL4_9AGAR|nr:glycosyltransferase family 2 protein [Amanita thiersii Skay4041]